MGQAHYSNSHVTYSHELFDIINSFTSDGMAAGRFAYWRSDTKKHRHFDPVERILVLDTTTMEWSVITAPFPPGESYGVADMPEHGGLCLSPARSNAFSSGSATASMDWWSRRIFPC